MQSQRVSPGDTETNLEPQLKRAGFAHFFAELDADGQRIIGFFIYKKRPWLTRVLDSRIENRKLAVAILPMQPSLDWRIDGRKFHKLVHDTEPAEGTDVKDISLGELDIKIIYFANLAYQFQLTPLLPAIKKYSRCARVDVTLGWGIPSLPFIRVTERPALSREWWLGEPT